MFCPKCGNELKEGFKFCNKCGTAINNISDQIRGEDSNTPSGASVPIAPIAPQSNPVMGMTGQEKKSSEKVWAVLAIILGILLVIGVTIIILAHNSVLDLTRNPFSGHSVAGSDESAASVDDDEEEEKGDDEEEKSEDEDRSLEEDIDSNAATGNGEGADSVAEASDLNGNVRHWDEELSVDEYTALTEDWIRRNGCTFEESDRGFTDDIEYPFSAIRVDGRLCVICECNYDDYISKYALLFRDNKIDDYCIEYYRVETRGISFDTGELITRGSNGASDTIWDILDIYNDSCTSIHIQIDPIGNKETSYSIKEGQQRSKEIPISVETVERIMKYHLGDGLMIEDLYKDDMLFDCYYPSPDSGGKLEDILTYYSSVEEAIENAYVINTSLPEDYYDHLEVESMP